MYFSKKCGAYLKGECESVFFVFCLFCLLPRAKNFAFIYSIYIESAFIFIIY